MAPPTAHSCCGSPQRLWALLQPKLEPGSYQQAHEPHAERPLLLQSILSAWNKLEAERERGEEMGQGRGASGLAKGWAPRGTRENRADTMAEVPRSADLSNQLNLTFAGHCPPHSQCFFLVLLCPQHTTRNSHRAANDIKL